MLRLEDGTYSPDKNAAKLLFELADLLAEAGVSDAALRVAEAVARGPNAPAARLGDDDRSWRRFREAFDAIRAPSPILPADVSDTTIGGLVWTSLDGWRFLSKVRRRSKRKTPVM